MTQSTSKRWPRVLRVGLQITRPEAVMTFTGGTIGLDGTAKDKLKSLFGN